MINHKKDEILFFYFPLNLLVLDDDEDFLNLILKSIKRKNISKYTSPEEAISVINPVNFNTKNLTVESNIKIYDLDYYSIKECFEDNQKKHGIIISDYRMPSMDGIEFLSKFNETDSVKILLTGEFRIENAVKALNEKIIDYYIEKETLDSIESIVNELEIQLFKKTTREIKKIIEKDSLPFLQDASFIEIFKNVCSQHKIFKYHIINDYGWYFLENPTEKFILNILHQRDLNIISEEYSGEDKIKIKNGEFIPSYFSLPKNKSKLISSNRYGDYSFCIEKYINS